jgi:hypothetical protein
MVEGYAGFGSDILADEFRTTAISSKTTEKLAHAWAQAFSEVTIASAAGIMTPSPIRGNTPIITAVPKAPLLLLCAATLLYALFALGLAIAAVRNVLARPGVREVQARLSIMGLTSQALEPLNYAISANSTEELFHKSEKSDDYSNRVAIYRTPIGGWCWGTLSTQQRRAI